jgi:pectin methylesterase-like acyl-CoA thioesterase
MTIRLSGAPGRPPFLAPAASACSTLLLAALCAPVHAQDSRDVREPVVPPSCAVLNAAPEDGTTDSARRDDSARIQAAIDKCAPGHALHLASGKTGADFISGPLVLRDGVTLYVDAGATLKASTNPMLFDRGAGACGTIDQGGRGCKPFITIDGIKGAGIMGEGVIDGQGGQRIDGKPETWWQIARRAQKEKGRQNVPRMIQIEKSRDITLYRITLRNSTNFHVAMSRVDGFTAWGVNIDTPKDARNTDGIDPGASRNVTIAYSHIRTGDDNIAIKAGSGMSENISILHNRFYSGHGMSIGSETNGGVRNVLVEDLDMDGTTSGLRIKSNDRRGGVVQNVVYRDVCLRNIRWPLFIDTQYEPGQGPGQSYPSYTGIRMENVHSLTPGDKVVFEGYSDTYPLQLTLKDVVVDGAPMLQTKFAKLAGQLNAADARPLDCGKRFAPFPGPDQSAGADRVLRLPPGTYVQPKIGEAEDKLVAGDHFVEARVRPAAPGNSPSQAILMVRYADPRNWTGAAIDLGPGKGRISVALLQMRDGQLTRLRQMGHDAAPAGGFQTLRVELADGELSAWLDGERVAAKLPAPPPAGGTALFAQDGAFEFDDLRIGASGQPPGRVALVRRGAGIDLQAGETQRYPVSALAGDASTPLAVTAASSDPAVARVAMEGTELVVTALRAGRAVVTLSSALDRNVASAIGVAVGPAFSARGDGSALRGRLLPAAGATDVQADTLLRIRFDQAPTLGASGSIRIYRAADYALVDVIQIGDETDAIGYPGQASRRVVRFNPIGVDGRDAVIHLHSAKLDYGTDYLVAVDAATFSGATIAGKPFEGIASTAGWRFRTRTQAPGGRAFTVDDDGPADFRTVQGALNHVMRAVPRAEPVTIRIANGRYDELLYLRGKDRVTLHGESRDGVVIGTVNNDGINPGAGASQPDQSPAIGGGRSVFLAEDADLLTLEHLTIVNKTVRAASQGSQAEALYFGSDRGRLVARDASFLSEQDTILVKGYSWFYRTLIAGNVDFIWGTNRAALFEDSEIRSVGDSAHPKGGGYVVQARTVAPDEAGFVFLNSRLTHGPGPAGNDVPAGSSWLARPGPSGAGDKVTYINCRIDAHIAPTGWSLPKAVAPGSRPGAGWAEYGSTDLAGQPLDLSNRAGGRILSPADAERYASRARVFASFDEGKGWNPAPEPAPEHRLAD